jgi:heptosyltransferase I
MKVLVIKTTSLGDIIHTLPALTDAGKKIDRIRFDWVVEEAFKEVPAWHPLVNRVISVAFRRLRKTPVRSLLSQEWRDFRAELQKEQYDLVVDAQGLVKSAVLTWMSRGLKVGLNKKSLTESLARFAYQKTVDVDLQKHAVWRMRSIFAQALGYELPEDEPDYGLVKSKFEQDDWSKGDYLVFVHGTTWPSKHWPDEYWLKLAELVTKAGYYVRLPWGNDEERARVEKIAAQCAKVEIIPKMGLTGIAGVIAGAKAVVAVDTGLGHLAAALDVPAVSLYGPTKPGRTGTAGANQVHLVSNFECIACDKPSCRYAKTAKINPACFADLTPELVWDELQQLKKSSVLLSIEDELC